MTPRLILNRLRHTERATVGALYREGPFFLCDTLERGPGDPPGANRPQLDRIPAGEHPLRVRAEGGYHQRAFKRWPGMHRGMVEIVVPGRTFILIHWGNYWRDTLGCILVGDGVFTDGDGEPAVGSSRKTYERIYADIWRVADARGTILITDESA